MLDVASELQAFVPFRRLGQGVLCAAAREWIPHRLTDGQTLWNQGEPNRGMALLVAGELDVRVDNQDVGRVRARDLVGECSAYSFGSVRSATLRTSRYADLLLLSPKGLYNLRQDHPEFYDVLLDLALGAVTRRIRATDTHVARLSDGVLPAPSTRGGGRRGRKKGLPGMGALPMGPCPPLRPLLERLPNLESRSDKIYLSLEVCFTQRFLQMGELIFAEGEAGSAAYIVADGEVHVVRYVRGRRADILARLVRGDVFGTITLVSPGTRTASCMAPYPTWVYEMNVQTYRIIPQEARQAWRESIIASLGMQLRNANQLLSRTLRGERRSGPLSPEDYSTLLQAAGQLQSLKVK